MQNPIQTILRFPISQDFFKTLIFFYCFDPLYYTGEIGKKSFLVHFYSAKSISEHFAISKLSQVFFQKINFFTVSTPYTAQVRKLKSAKNHFLMLFCIEKIISDHLKISKLFQVSRKINFFHCFDPYTAKVGNMKSDKNHFLVLLYGAKSISDHFTVSNFSSFFQKNYFYCFDPLYCTGEKSEVSKRLYFNALL